MKIIFLDVDGVLNTSETWERKHNEFINTGKVICPIDEFRIKYLKEIIDKTDAKVVLFSTWSGGFKKDNDLIIPARNDAYAGELYNFFSKYNIEIYDKISKIEINIKNKDKLKIWLENNHVEEFIIIEDEPKSLLEDFSDNIIDVSLNGLCEEHIELSIKKLNSSKQKIISKKE